MKKKLKTFEVIEVMLFKYKNVSLGDTVWEIGVNLIVILMLHFIVILNSHDKNSAKKTE